MGWQSPINLRSTDKKAFQPSAPNVHTWTRNTIHFPGQPGSTARRHGGKQSGGSAHYLLG